MGSIRFETSREHARKIASTQFSSPLGPEPELNFCTQWGFNRALSAGLAVEGLIEDERQV